MIDLKRIGLYRKIWKQLNHQYTVEVIASTIEVIEKTESYPRPDEYSYVIWSEYLQVRSDLS